MTQSETLKIVIVGHVDHGKSTLIGRLFYDTGSIPEIRYQEIAATCKAQGREFEFAYLMDALEEERTRTSPSIPLPHFSRPQTPLCHHRCAGHKQFLKT
jgi:bifunctional enzyme CysN/CysC/sulfate adenylyltransferase subunit 1